MTSVGVIAHTAKELGGGLPEFRKTLASYGITDPPWSEVPKSKYVPDRIGELMSTSASGSTIMWFFAPPSACTRFPCLVPVS